MPGRSLEVGTGETDVPVPLVRTTGGGDGCRWYAPFRSGAAEPHGDELGRVARLHAHQDRAFAFLLRIANQGTDVGRRKLAGILAEALGSGSDALVLGYGINVAPMAYPPDIADRAKEIGFTEIDVIDDDLGR